MTARTKTDVLVTFECDKCHAKKESKAETAVDAHMLMPKDWKTLNIKVSSTGDAFYEAVSADLCPRCFSVVSKAIGLDVKPTKRGKGKPFDPDIRPAALAGMRP